MSMAHKRSFRSILTLVFLGLFYLMVSTQTALAIAITFNLMLVCDWLLRYSWWDSRDHLPIHLIYLIIPLLSFSLGIATWFVSTNIMMTTLLPLLTGMSIYNLLNLIIFKPCCDFIITRTAMSTIKKVLLKSITNLLPVIMTYCLMTCIPAMQLIAMIPILLISSAALVVTAQLVLTLSDANTPTRSKEMMKAAGDQENVLCARLSKIVHQHLTADTHLDYEPLCDATHKLEKLIEHINQAASRSNTSVTGFSVYSHATLVTPSTPENFSYLYSLGGFYQALLHLNPQAPSKLPAWPSPHKSYTTKVATLADMPERENDKPVKLNLLKQALYHAITVQKKSPGCALNITGNPATSVAAHGFAARPHPTPRELRKLHVIKFTPRAHSPSS